MKQTDWQEGGLDGEGGSADAGPESAIKCPWLAKVCRGLNGIGLTVIVVPQASGFLTGVRIVAGELHVAPDCHVSDALHEAGHLAVMPGRYRARANDDLDVVTQEMLEDLERQALHPDDPLYRAIIQCSDPEATALAFALGRHFGVPDELIILDHQYPDESGEGSGADVRTALAMGAYIGIHGLQHAGFCSTNRFGRLPRFPSMAKWLQDW